MHRNPEVGEVVESKDAGRTIRWVIEEVGFASPTGSGEGKWGRWAEGRRLSPRDEYQPKGQARTFWTNDYQNLELLGKMKRVFIWDTKY